MGGNQNRIFQECWEAAPMDARVQQCTGVIDVLLQKHTGVCGTTEGSMYDISAHENTRQEHK